MMVWSLYFAASAQGEKAKKEAGKISGLAFGDYYFVSNQHDSSIEGMNGFWFRRIYFTYDQKIDPPFAIRFRVEAKSPGDFKTNDTLNPFVKDAYLQYTQGRHSVYFGLIPTPTWDTLETLVGYRPVERAPLDLYKMGEARDTGIAFRGFLDVEKTTGYAIMVGNGSGTKAETDKGKAFYMSLSHRFSPRLYLEGYTDFWDKPGNQDWNTIHGFLVYQTPKSRVSALFAWQSRKRTGQSDLQLNVASFYVDHAVSVKIRPFFRWDHVSDPVPDADKIAYLPMANHARPAFYMVGVDFAASPGVHIIPNIEMVKYSSPTSGAIPDNDLYFKATVYFVWK
ncbi:MAG: hypothetical protein ACREJQ_06265 [bacterium]